MNELALRILGIDPGTATTGWGVIEKNDASKNGLRMVSYGVIKTPAKMQNCKRLIIIHRELSQIIEKYKPNSVAVEKLFFTRNQKTAMTVGEARGVVLYTIESHGVNLAEYTPLQIKSRICGYGKAQKRDVQFDVQDILEMEEKPRPDDAADGLAVAICSTGFINPKGNNVEKPKKKRKKKTKKTKVSKK